MKYFNKIASEDKSFIREHPVLTAAGTAAALAGGIGIARHIKRHQQVKGLMKDIKSMGYTLTKEEEVATKVLAEEVLKRI